MINFFVKIHFIDSPPSTASIAPVIQDVSSDTKYITAFATSG